MHSKRTLSVSRTAHYHLQIPQNEIKSILYVIHGYAQLAAEFIKEFAALEKHGILVVAPEGLSKFYGKERLPVASWMTQHEREDEIKDYIQYLQKLIRVIKSEYGEKPILLLGFSQGVSTAFRYLAASEDKISLALACSGSIPPELNASDFENQRDLTVNYYYGNDDRLLKPENAKEQLLQLERLKLNFNYHAFEGRHEISETCIQAIINFQNKLS